MIPQEAADYICDQIAEGRSLRSILKDADMPASSTVFKALAADREFAERYARAREVQADALFDEILDIADDSKNDTIVDADGNISTDQEVVARSRIRIDARKWMAGKLRPKVYGEKLDLNHSGRIGIAKEMSEEDLARIAAGGGD
jgi:hypothetical protein